VEAVAWGGEQLTLAPAALERVAAGQAELLALLAGGARVYGVNTGMGFFAAVDLDEAAQAGHQRNLLLGRAVGGPPWLPAGEARALLVARLGNLLRRAARRRGGAGRQGRPPLPAARQGGHRPAGRRADGRRHGARPAAGG
jgi:histidine ammonia-lyase